MSGDEPEVDPLFLNPWTSALIMLLYAVVFCAAVIGNALVLGAVTANPSMHSSVNLLILNMSIADLLLVLVVMVPNLHGELFFGARALPVNTTLPVLYLPTLRLRTTYTESFPSPLSLLPSL